MWQQEPRGIRGILPKNSSSKPMNKAKGILPLVRHLCSGRLCLASMTLAVSLHGARAAGIVEDFSYTNGGLIAVSGNAWELWESGDDATVVDGAARYEDTTDVIRSFPTVLSAPGDTATFSFSMWIAAANTIEGYEIAFEPSSEPFGLGNTNYGSGIALGFDFLNGPAGMSTIQVAEGWGDIIIGNESVNTVEIGAMTAGVTHRVSISLERGAAQTSYSVYLDGLLLHSGNCVINDIRGINSVELDQAGLQGTPAGFAIIDDLVIVPEPTSVLLLAVGSCAGLITRRRRC